MSEEAGEKATMEGLEGGVDYLADERKKTQFDVDAMKIFWAGGRHEFQVADRIARLVASDPVSITLSLSRSLSLLG